jgi:plasmid replication initiation protein
MLLFFNFLMKKFANNREQNMNKKSNSDRNIIPSIDIITKDEMNLAEFPFTLLSHRTSENQKTIEIDQKIRDRNGRIISQKWIVTGSDKFGLPLAADNDIYLSLMQMFKENGFESRQIYFTRYQLLKTMEQIPSKQTYKMLERALDRLISVTVKSVNAFWDNRAKTYVTKAFHLFDSYDLYDERNRNYDDIQPRLPLSNVVISEFLFNSIKSSYIKSLDIGFYFTLQTPLTRRLYRFLDKKKYHKNVYEIDILSLASLMPLHDPYPSQIKRRLEKAHQELTDKGYLKSVVYKKNQSSGQEIVVYVFEGLSLPEQPELNLEFNLHNLEKSDAILQKLTDRGITKAVAQRLATDHSKEQIENQIEAFDWLTMKKSPLLDRNSAGFLRKAIEDNYQMPTNYFREKERESTKQKRKQEKEAEQLQLEETQRQIDRYRRQLTEQERNLLRQEVIELIENDKAIRKEFVSEILIQAKESEIIRRKLGLESS